MQAKGSFEVKITPQPLGHPEEGAPLGRMLVDKQFHGDLEAVGVGEMLAAGNGAKGSSGGYVAIERVTGVLQGKSGSFILQHSGTMTRGVPQLSITVVPDSGTGELAGISGSIKIDIAEGKHFYTFDYALAPAP
ncbi:MAG: DUF3224 domain-containing protein [Burkholderiaceae bacterium]|nr:DUF3224 domain-containing protein [Burkholderiaceae bacterium]